MTDFKAVFISYFFWRTGFALTENLTEARIKRRAGVFVAEKLSRCAVGALKPFCFEDRRPIVDTRQLSGNARTSTFASALIPLGYKTCKNQKRC
jgi:hypothetical protein